MCCKCFCSSFSSWTYFWQCSLFRCAHFCRTSVLFFPWEIIKSRSGLRVLMVPCEIYPIVWQAWEGVFGCVYINEAKIGTINRKWYVVDVLFCFSARLLLSGLVISVCMGMWRPWFTYLLLWLKINMTLVFNLT